MLAKCEEHGYYRAEVCPVCHKEGKFLMDDDEMDRIGRTVTGILRHFPQNFGVDIDEHGFVSIEDMAQSIKRRKRGVNWLKEEHIIALCETDGKGRYEIKDGRIRTTYGHTIDVNLDDLPDDNIPEKLYYPAAEEEAPMLIERGIKPSDRGWVHLSGTKEKAMEAGLIRNESPVILAIDAKKAIEEGRSIKRAGKEVYLVKEVTSEYLSQEED